MGIRELFGRPRPDPGPTRLVDFELASWLALCVNPRLSLRPPQVIDPVHSTGSSPQPASATGSMPLHVRLGWIVGRSLLPLVALGLLLGTLLWGPWVSLVLTYLWWRLVTRIG